MIQSLKNTVIQGDCLDVMKSMPDKCVDLVLTDPPYGIGMDGCKCFTNPARPCRDFRLKNPKYKKKEWDIIPDKKYFDEIFRISKNQVIWGGNYFVEYLKSSPGWIFWDKKFENQNFADGELAWTNFKQALKKFTMSSKAETKGGLLRVHPTQKPVALFQWILQNYSEQGMTIFDPFAGSGTTAIACLETGRNYILVEKDPEYVEIINKRISEWKEQGRLFTANG